MAKSNWILEGIGKNFRQYVNVKNPRLHKTICDSGDPTQEWQVGASSDDCYRRLVSSLFSLTSSYCYCGDYSSSLYDFRSGVRFINLNIPQGSTIDSAYLQLKAYVLYGGIPETFIEGENSDNAATFSTADDYDGRPRTSASVSWTPSAWDTDTWYNSSDIKTVVQEIVNRAGWASGNALALFWRDAAGWSTPSRVSAHSYDSAAANAPKLEITWTEEEIVLKEVTDSLTLSDSVSVNKNLIVTDSLSMADSVLRDKPLVEILDSLSLSDVVSVNKTMTVQDVLSIADAVSVDTGVTLKEVLDTLTLQDLINVNKTLKISDTLTLQDFIEKVGEILLNKTKLDKAKLDKAKRDK